MKRNEKQTDVFGLSLNDSNGNIVKFWRMKHENKRRMCLSVSGKI